MKFTFLTGDINWQQYGGKFVSKKLNNGEFDYWLVIEFLNMWDATGDESAEKYNVSILAVSPQMADQKGIDKAFSSAGYDDETLERVQDNPLMQVEALASYGLAAHLWDASGNNASALMKQARQEAQKIEMLFGFYMDQPENRIGNTGWDIIAGHIGFS